MKTCTLNACFRGGDNIQHSQKKNVKKNITDSQKCHDLCINDQWMQTSNFNCNPSLIIETQDSAITPCNRDINEINQALVVKDLITPQHPSSANVYTCTPTHLNVKTPILEMPVFPATATHLAGLFPSSNWHRMLPLWRETEHEDMLKRLEM